MLSYSIYRKCSMPVLRSQTVNLSITVTLASCCLLVVTATYALVPQHHSHGSCSLMSLALSQYHATHALVPLDSLAISLPLTSNSLDNLDFLTCGEQIDKARHVRKQERRDAETRQREHEYGVILRQSKAHERARAVWMMLRNKSVCCCDN